MVGPFHNMVLTMHDNTSWMIGFTTVLVPFTKSYGITYLILWLYDFGDTYVHGTAQFIDFYVYMTFVGL